MCHRANGSVLLLRCFSDVKLVGARIWSQAVVLEKVFYSLSLLPPDLIEIGLVAFIDTGMILWSTCLLALLNTWAENTFRPDRIKAIAERFSLDGEAALENIVVGRALNSEHRQSPFLHATICWAVI